jgi:hypothetical protein
VLFYSEITSLQLNGENWLCENHFFHAIGERLATGGW